MLTSKSDSHPYITQNFILIAWQSGRHHHQCTLLKLIIQKKLKPEAENGTTSEKLKCQILPEQLPTLSPNEVKMSTTFG